MAWCMDGNINREKQIQEDHSLPKFVFPLKFTPDPSGIAVYVHFDSKDIKKLSINNKYLKNEIV